MKKIIHTTLAPAAIGTYSQAIAVGSHANNGTMTVYLSGQIPLIPETMQLIEGNMHEQVRQVFKNLASVCEAAGGSLNHMVKLNVYLTNLTNFPIINEVMAELFAEPYPARAAIGVSALPKGAQVEVDGVMVV